MGFSDRWRSNEKESLVCTKVWHPEQKPLLNSVAIARIVAPTGTTMKVGLLIVPTKREKATAEATTRRVW